MTSSRKILVVGARPGSIGAAVATKLKVLGQTVETAGISEEQWRLVATPQKIHEFFIGNDEFTDVVCTIGTNGEQDILASGFDPDYLGDEYAINTIAPIAILHEWLMNSESERASRHFVAISSNSAHIARSRSLGYCASKAALSMALRCAARRVAEMGGVSIYGYEPGWVDGTPMSRSVEKRIGDSPPHRIPGRQGVSLNSLSNLIIFNLLNGGMELNGCMFRVDGGEQ